MFLQEHGLRPLDTRSHWKPLRVGYAYDQFENFGPEIHRILRPVISRSPQRLLNSQVPLYGGEMLAAARPA